MFVVVCYDIPDNRRRNKVSQTLEGFGVRVQLSVFECDVTDKELADLRKRVKRLLKPEEDLVRYYQLCQACLGRVGLEGSGTVHQDAPYYIV